MQIVSINKDDFEDAISDGANNTMAQTDFCDMARRRELLIYDHELRENLMIVVPNGTAVNPQNITDYYRPVLVSYTGVAKYLRISDSEALHYIHAIQINPLVELNEFSHDGIYLKEDFDNRMREFTRNNGITIEEAQLQLGITERSMVAVRPCLHYFDTGKVLRTIVEGFFSSYLYPKKTYVTRKDAIEDFVRNFNCKHPTSCIEIQYCDDCPDDNKLPASSKCCHCGKYLCHKHSIWVEPTTILPAPEKICHDCQLAGEQ